MRRRGRGRGREGVFVDGMIRLSPKGDNHVSHMATVRLGRFMLRLHAAWHLPWEQYIQHRVGVKRMKKSIELHVHLGALHGRVDFGWRASTRRPQGG